VEKLVVAAAVPCVNATVVKKTPSIVKDTDPVGDAVPEFGATVAVSVTVGPVEGLEGFAAIETVVPPLTATVVNAVARALPSTDPRPLAWSYPVPAE
jgi:hypothetical protein